MYLWRNLKNLPENERAYYKLTCTKCAPSVIGPEFHANWGEPSFDSTLLYLKKINPDCANCKFVCRVAKQCLPGVDLESITIEYLRGPEILRLIICTVRQTTAHFHLFSKGACFYPHPVYSAADLLSEQDNAANPYSLLANHVYLDPASDELVAEVKALIEGVWNHTRNV